MDVSVNEFYDSLKAEIREAYLQQKSDLDNEFPYEENVFTQKVMEYMESISLIENPMLCYFQRKIGNANVKLNAFDLNLSDGVLSLLISFYKNENVDNEIPRITFTEVQNYIKQCFRFIEKSLNKELDKLLTESDPAYALSSVIQENYNDLDSIEIFVLTDCIAPPNKMYKPMQLPNGKTIKTSVMDIERLYRQIYAGKPRDELVVNFETLTGNALPCVYTPLEEQTGYGYALMTIPGQVLFSLYESYSTRLLEDNVRSFLQATGKVNKGIRETLRKDPKKFMAYNNGLVLVADRAEVVNSENGGVAIKWLKGLQIVNGGQTTASIYFTKKKFPNETNLDLVRVPAKLIILGDNASSTEIESLITDISTYANSQNSVKQADLNSNAKFHKSIERIIQTLYCDDGMTQWFYERSSGSYKVKLLLEGNSKAKLKQLKLRYPKENKITKEDLGIYLNTWDQYPYEAANGNQKNFGYFITKIQHKEKEENFEPDKQWVKDALAKAILFKKANEVIATIKTQSPKDLTEYVISYVSFKIGARINLNMIWKNQDISEKFKTMLLSLASEMYKSMSEVFQNGLFSEYAKKQSLWDFVKSHSYESFMSNYQNLPEYIKSSD